MNSPIPFRPCWVEINTHYLEENYAFLRSQAGSAAECLAIVKADAYGHSLRLCAPAAVRAGARWLGVTSVEEGVLARSVCPDARILVMGGVFPGQGRAIVDNGLTAVVWDETQLTELESAAAGASPRPLPVHLEIDTGMSRQGVSLTELPAFLRRLSATGSFRIEALMTHLYASDEAGKATSSDQLERLKEAVLIVRGGLAATTLQPEFLSVGASAALLGEDAIAVQTLAREFNLRPMLRLGLALYGLAPHFDPAFAPGPEPAALRESIGRLQPVLAWKTRVTSVRTVAAGAEVGYNGTFVATEPLKLALLAVGYADGLDRQLGNRFDVLVRGERAPLVGRISMDQAVVDVTDIAGVQPGDEVILIGHQGGETITALDHAAASGTIPWEIFTRIAHRVPRVHV